MPDVSIVAALPFPLRVDPTPYQIAGGRTTWSLRVERVPREHPDERIAGPGTNMDLLVDRSGQLAYSRVTGQAALDAASPPPLYSFLDALNLLILHVRDVFGEYWIRTLEPADLHQVTINSPSEGVAHFYAGRGQAFTLPTTGLTEEANERLVAALSAGGEPPVWRQLHLDARDALELGRDEDCVVLTWSALEAACRQALPGMAHRAGRTVAQVADRLDVRNRVKKPPISFEEAVERGGRVLTIVQMVAELTQPRVYHPETVRRSVEFPYLLRNRIAHQGARIERQDATRAWGAVESVLAQALTLRDVQPPPPTLSWRARFRGVRPEVKAFVTSTGKRLVLARPDGSHFRMEQLGEDLWLRFADDITQPMAAALVLSQWDAWGRARRTNWPHLRPGQAGGLFLEGAVDLIASEVQRFVCLAESMIAESKTNVVMRDVAAYIVSRGVAQLASAPPIGADDSSWITLSALLAAQLALLPKGGYPRRLRPLRTTQPSVYRASAAWGEALAGLDPDDEHSRCAVLQRIHADALWLDTIMVVCPREGVAYGSRRWPLSEAPLRQ